MRELKIRCWKQEEGATDNGMILSDKLVLKETGLLCNLLKDSNTHKYMLYTGLVDRNVLEIYEEDIVQSKRFSGVIKYLNGCYYISTFRYMHFLPLDESISKDIEVIGNIYETPDFLNQ